MTDLAPPHANHVRELRERARLEQDELTICALLAAADLLEVHDTTGLSLDFWTGPKALVEHLIGEPIKPNEA